VKALVIGTGSIGQRHISNLLRLGVDVSAFSYRSAAGESIQVNPAVKLVADVKSALASVDFAVVANRTDQHIDVAIEVAKRGKHLFIEKPLSASLASVGELCDLVKSQGLIVEAGYTLRFHPNLVWLKSFLESGQLGDVYYARAMVGQWLPSWRPGSDYRKSYGAFRSRGGGVIFDLVHELDLVTWLCGPAEEVSAFTQVVPALEIETEGVAQIGMRLSGGVLAQVHLDYVRPTYGRSLEIVGYEGTIAWDYTRGEVSFTKRSGETTVLHRVDSSFERNSMFLSHMEHMVARLRSSDVSARSSLFDSVEVLKIALAAHQSATSRRHVTLADLNENL